MKKIFAFLVGLSLVANGCGTDNSESKPGQDVEKVETLPKLNSDSANALTSFANTAILVEMGIKIEIAKDIPIRNYFQFIDSIVDELSCILSYPISEHIIVHHNNWIIDSLASFDYYLRMERGMFINDQRDMVILHQGDMLRIPDSIDAKNIELQFENTVIDVNIPEFKLRIYEYDTVKYTFTVRVGRNEVKYLKTARRSVSLKTPIGEGKIVRIERDPYFVNPVNGRAYSNTTRDDGKVTRMPQIPWLEPEIDGIRSGSLIHPTSNPETLGKSYSNACVGTGEGDAWIIYYHAPLHTKVRFRYDLEIPDESGNTVLLKDIYKIK